MTDIITLYYNDNDKSFFVAGIDVRTLKAKEFDRNLPHCTGCIFEKKSRMGPKDSLNCVLLMNMSHIWYPKLYNSTGERCGLGNHIYVLK